MNYDLPDFPPDVQYEVEVAKIWYGDKFKRRMQNPRYRVWHHWSGKPEDLLIPYILSVWRVFLREADTRCLWRADLDSKAREFLRQLTIELYYAKGFDYEGRKLPDMLNHAFGGIILDRVMQKFRCSGTWKYFEEVRLRATKPAKQLAAVLDSATGLADQATAAAKIKGLGGGVPRPGQGQGAKVHDRRPSRPGRPGPDIVLGLYKTLQIEIPLYSYSTNQNFPLGGIFYP